MEKIEWMFLGVDIEDNSTVRFVGHTFAETREDAETDLDYDAQRTKFRWAMMVRVENFYENEAD